MSSLPSFTPLSPGLELLQLQLACDGGCSSKRVQVIHMIVDADNALLKHRLLRHYDPVTRTFTGFSWIYPQKRRHVMSAGAQ